MIELGPIMDKKGNRGGGIEENVRRPFIFTKGEFEALEVHHKKDAETRDKEGLTRRRR